MNLNVMYEDLARAQNRERLERARAANQGLHLARSLRLARRSRRVVLAAKLRPARAV
jgi:hypothetical protein